MGGGQRNKIVMRFSTFDKKDKLLLALVLISVLYRLIVILNFYPVLGRDSQSYIDLARQIKNLDFHGYDGFRTPLYPLFILLSGLDFYSVWLVQAIMGIAISAMLFSITWHQTKNSVLSFIIGLLHSLSINQLFFEANMASDTFCIFLIILSLFLLSRMYHSGNYSRLNIFILGLAAGLAGLAHPRSLIIIPIYFIFLFFRLRKETMPRLAKTARLAVFVIPVIILVLGWSAFNKITINYFGLTTQLGASVIGHGIPFIELAPDEYADIKHPLLRNRLARFGPRETKNDILAEIQEKSGVTAGEFSGRLTSMALEMYWAHPAPYLKSVAKSWLLFWSFPVKEYSQINPNTIKWKSSGFNNNHIYQCLNRVPGIPEKLTPFIKNNALKKTLNLSLSAGKIFRPFTSVIFIGICIYLLYAFFIRKTASDMAFNLMIVIIIILASLLQAFLEAGSNYRYALPYQPLIVYVVFVVIYEYFTRERNKESPMK